MRITARLKEQIEVKRGGSFHNPSELAADHDPTQLLGHFVLGTRVSVAPDSWLQRELSGWILRYEGSLPVFDLVDADDSPIGWLLGHAIDVDARTIVAGSRCIPVAKGAPDFCAHFRAWLYRYGGRYVAILIDPMSRAYNDPLGTLPVLFDPGMRRIASSPFLLVDAGHRVPDSPLTEVIDPYVTGRYYPFVETSHRDANRLLPSHELDLDTFEQHRVWPTGPLSPVAPEEAVETIGSIVEASIAAAIDADTTVLGMTAGGDCRMLLACTRRLAENLCLYTVPYRDAVGQNDAATAADIANEFGLKHRRLPWINGSDEDVRLWFYRTGALSGESRGRRGTQTYDQLANEGRVLRVSGVGVEIARGHVWNRGLKKGETRHTSTGVTADDLLAILGVPHHPALVDSAAQWLQGVPGLDVLDTIDLCFLEATHGGWSGPITMGNPGAFTTTIYPFGHRAIFEAVFGLAHDYRGADRLRHDVIAARWPELARFPVNVVPRRGGLSAKARRVAWMPGGVIRRIRRRRLRE